MVSEVFTKHQMRNLAVGPSLGRKLTETLPWQRLAVLVVVASAVAGDSVNAQDGTGRGSNGERPWHAALGLPGEQENDAPSSAEILRAAQGEVILGRPARALSILNSHSIPDSQAAGIPSGVFAAAQYLLGQYVEAGSAFAEAATYADGLRRGILWARAGEAYERAGQPIEASSMYHQAGIDFPDARRWLALRQASLAPDPPTALRLLHSAPMAGRILVAGIRAAALAEIGDLEAAERNLIEVGLYAAAGRLALEAGDSVRARSLAYRAAEMNRREEAEAGVAAALADFQPESAAEHLIVAKALRRFATAGRALVHARAAFESGDSSMATRLFLGELTEASGDRRGAIRVYDAAVRAGGPDAGEAEYRSARGHLRMRERNVAYAAFSSFLERRPDHDRAPAAFFLMGDLRQDQGRLREADSLFRLLQDTWPTDTFASNARSRLAARALLRKDTAAAMEILRIQVEHGGSPARAAQYQLASLAQEVGDSAMAIREWTALAHRDSIGYYGTAARQAAGLPEPTFPKPQRREVSGRVNRELSVLDLLSTAGLEREAAAQLAYLTESDEWDVIELVEIAEGLISRGSARVAVNLGWRIAGLHRLNDPRVLRIIFPWPNRELVEREAGEFDLDPYLMAALIRQESAFDADATSRAGARGMMQLMPATARGLARQLGVAWDNAFLGVADANVHLGAAHLATMLKQYDGEVVPALAAYNAGGSRVRRWLRFPEAGDWFSFIERVPFPETRGYLRTLLRNRALYEALYGENAPL